MKPVLSHYGERAVRDMYGSDKHTYPPNPKAVRELAFWHYNKAKQEKSDADPTLADRKNEADANADLTIIAQEVDQMTEHQVAMAEADARMTMAGRVMTRRRGTAPWYRAIHKAASEEVEF